MLNLFYQNQMLSYWIKKITKTECDFYYFHYPGRLKVNIKPVPSGLSRPLFYQKNLYSLYLN